MSSAKPQRTIPPTFPRSMPVAALPGVQPKLAVRKDGDLYTTGYSEAELAERFDVCDDLLRQLQPYCVRKRAEHPEWTAEQLLAKVERSLRTKGWGLTDLEVAWLIGQLKNAA